MRIAMFFVAVAATLSVACSGSDSVGTSTAVPTPATTLAASVSPSATEATSTLTASATESPLPTSSPTALGTPPGRGLFQALAYFGELVPGGPAGGSETDGLYLADGNDVIALTPAAGADFEINGMPSPDGTSFANGGDLGLTRTVIADGTAISTGQIPGLGDFGTGLMYPCAWLPDSTAVVFVFRRQGASAPEGIGVYDFDNERLTIIDEVDFKGGTSPQVPDCPGLSPDGKTLAFAGRRNAESNLYVASTGGGPARPFSSGAPLDVQGTPTILADGSIVTALIVVDPPAIGGANNYEIAVVTPDGAVHNLTNDGHYDFAPAVSPGGSRVAFLSNRDGTLALYTMPFAGGEALLQVAPLPNEPADFAIAAMAWSPDGMRLALSTGAANGARIYIVELATAAVSPAGSRGRFGLAPNWLPDNSGIIF